MLTNIYYQVIVIHLVIMDNLSAMDTIIMDTTIMDTIIKGIAIEDSLAMVGMLIMGMLIMVMLTGGTITRDNLVGIVVLSDYLKIKNKNERILILELELFTLLR